MQVKYKNYYGEETFTSDVATYVERELDSNCDSGVLEDVQQRVGKVVASYSRLLEFLIDNNKLTVQDLDQVVNGYITGIKLVP